MIQGPSLLGLIPLAVFILTIVRGWNAVSSVAMATIVGAILAGVGPVGIATDLQESLGEFLSYIGLVILAGGGLGKIAERTGVSQNIVSFIVNRVGLNTPNRVILGTGISSAVMVALLGTLAGANAVVAPVVIPIMAAAGVSSAVGAVLFQGFGATGLFLGPFTPPMVTFQGLTGLSYLEVVLYAGLPISAVLWVTTFIYAKRILGPTMESDAYTAEDTDTDQQSVPRNVSAPATAAFLLSLLGFIVYGIVVEGGSTFALFVILATAVVTGIAARLRPNELAETFIEGARPLVWLFITFVLFTPFLVYMDQMGGFQAVGNLLQPLIDAGGRGLFVVVSTLIGVVGVPGASVAQSQLIDELFASQVIALDVPMSLWVLVLLVGSQITNFLYPTGDTLGAMGLARSSNIRNMVIFGIVASIPCVVYVILATFIY